VIAIPIVGTSYRIAFDYLLEGALVYLESRFTIYVLKILLLFVKKITKNINTTLIIQYTIKNICKEKAKDNFFTYVATT